MLLRGLPPYPCRVWTKTQLIDALVVLAPKKKVGEFVTKVIQLGNTEYKHRSGIYKMFDKWKASGLPPPSRGRPMSMELDKAQVGVSNVLRSRATNSSAFMLDNMKDMYTNMVKERVAEDGLDPECVKSGCSDKLAKAMTMAVAMGGDVGKLTNKKLLKKTEKRFQAEHSIFSAYAYALTVLSTHYVEGPVPSKLKQFQLDKLDPQALETVEWMKTALEAESVHPVNPNLVTSCDDSTMFVIEGVKGGAGEWEWKIVDDVNNNSSVRSDFKVEDEAETTGGLRVRLTFTISASGLSAPPFIAVSGLSEEELCPILCEDGILALAAKVPGLCKGGDNVGNVSGFG